MPEVSLNLITVGPEKPDAETYSKMSNNWYGTGPDYPTIQFFEDVLNGHAFTCILREHFRSEKNFAGLQHLALDFDEGGISPESFKDDPLVNQFGAFAYPTMSSRAGNPRTRLVFVLDQPIKQYTNARRGVAAMLHLYGQADKACSDPARLHLPAGREGEGAYYGKVLPVAKLKTMIERMEADVAAVEQRRPQKGVFVGTGNDKPLLMYWENRILGARAGERNVTLNKAAFSLFDLVLQGRLDESAVRGVLEYAGSQAGLTDVEISKTIESGLKGAREHL